MESTSDKPSWMRWPPNCCESCQDWNKKEKITTIAGDIVSDYTGICNSPISMEHGEVTDSRYRCPSFKRKPGV